MDRLAARTAAATAAAVLLGIAPAQAAAPWHPDTKAAAAYAQHRRGVISFAVRTGRHQYGYHPRRTFPSASVLKPMLLLAYLNEREVRNRRLTPTEKSLLGPMIRRSDNAAASAIFVRTGLRRLDRLARRAGMRRFAPATPVWGLSRIDSEDQARFFQRIDRLVPPRHRAYAMGLLNHITPSQRWGIATVRPTGWKLYFKGGWGSGTGAVDHQVALLTRRGERVSIAILTAQDGSHAYGKQTLRGIAKRLLRGLART